MQAPHRTFGSFWYEVLLRLPIASLIRSEDAVFKRRMVLLQVHLRDALVGLEHTLVALEVVEPAVPLRAVLTVITLFLLFPEDGHDFLAHLPYAKTVGVLKPEFLVEGGRKAVLLIDELLQPLLIKSPHMFFHRTGIVGLTVIAEVDGAPADLIRAVFSPRDLAGAAGDVGFAIPGKVLLQLQRLHLLHILLW